MSGVVYLIHLEEPIGRKWTDAEREAFGLPPRKPGAKYQSQHYLGFTDNLEERLEHHRSGNGSAFMAAVAFQGINWHLVRTWEPGDRTLERRLKDQHDMNMFCPVCNPQSWQKRGIFTKGTRR